MQSIFQQAGIMGVSPTPIVVLSHLEDSWATIPDQGKREGPREYWEKGQVLWICRGVGVVTSRVIRDEYRI